MGSPRGWRSREGISRIAIAVAIVIIVVVAGVSSYVLFSQPKQPQVVKIGELVELTGVLAQFGNAQLAGAKFAVDQLNKQGGLLGATVELDVVDTKGDATTGLTAFSKVVESDGVVAVTGITSSDVAIAINPVANNVSVPVVLSAAGSLAVLNKDSRYTFRMLTGLQEAQAVADFVKQNGYTRVVAIIGTNAFGLSIENVTKLTINAIPGAQLMTMEAPMSQTDWTQYMQKIQPFNPQVVILSGFPAAVIPFTKQMFAFGVHPNATITTLEPEPNIWNALGASVFKGFLTFGFYNLQDPQFISTATQFRNATGTYFNSYNALGYQNIMLIAAAIQKAGSFDPTKIRDAISGINYQSWSTYPFSYTSYGELKAANLDLFAFKPGPPPSGTNPGAQWHLETAFVSSPLPPPPATAHSG